ncbi:MAG: ATP-binding protein [Cyclobacteriaceae bacterium]
MLKRLLGYIETIGLEKNSDPNEERNIIMVNRLSLYSSFFVFVILIALFAGLPGRGWTPTRILLLVAGFLFSANLLLNKAGLFLLAKIMVSTVPVLFSLFISIFDKIYNVEFMTIKDFFFYRFLALTVTIFPLFIFSTRQIFLMILLSLPGIIVVVFGDYIHKLMGVGLSDFGFIDDASIIFDVMVGLAYIALFGFVLSLRLINDRYHNKISEQYQVLKLRNEEVLAQSEELKSGHDSLVEANRTIENQNRILEKMIDEKSQKLVMANEQLVLHNNELNQFSFAISHNLKSPVTSLKGLLYLFNESELSANNKEIYGYLKRTVNTMDSLYSDLGKILDLRQDLYQFNSLVMIEDEISIIKELLKKDLNNAGAELKLTSKSNEGIFTNKHKLRGIFHNLVSNAIKFKSPKRPLQIEVSFEESEEFYKFSVKDNGLGMDNKKHGDRVFHMFQRFHPDIDGKGLGLYMVKQQVESMGGSIELRSEPDVGSTFCFCIRKLQ